MIEEWHCRAVNLIVFESGAAAVFNEHLRGTKSGAAPTWERAVFLVGMLLGAWEDSRTHITTIHKVLTREVPLDWQYRWGVRQKRYDSHGRRAGDWIVTESDLQNVSRRISKVYNHTTAWIPDPIDQPGKHADQREQARANLYELVDTMLESTLIERPEGSSDYAIDSTGIWVPERYRKPLPEHVITDADGDDVLAAIAAEAMGEPTVDATAGVKTKQNRRTRIPRVRKPRTGHSDAGIGAKTRKDGKREWFWGHEVHAIVRAPAENADGSPRTEPALVERIRMTNPQDDVVEPSLQIIDAVRSTGRTIRRLMADRHYSYKKFDRWLSELIARGIDQVVDLRSDEQGFKEWDGVLIAGSWPHCPATPTNLGSIPKPGLGATEEAWAEFNARIAQRFSYAADRRKPLDTDGKSRWACPAKAGKIGCPLRPETVRVATEMTLPMVANPPQGSLPPICTQDSFGLDAKTDKQKSIMRLFQKDYWGSPAQLLRFDRRTFVEGFFGTLKGDTASNKKRGSNLYTGLAHATLDITAFCLITNVAHLRRWHEETALGDPSSPLLAGAMDTALGIVHVTQEEFEWLTHHRMEAA